MVGEHEHGGVKGRVGTPGALPLGVVFPAGVAELPGAHDLGPDPDVVACDEGVVDAAAATGLPRPGLEHPLVQPLPGMTEMQLLGLTLTGTETIERDRKEMDIDE